MTPLGQMDRLVTIQQATETRDPVTRAPKTAWATLGTAFMAVRPARGNERFTANQLSAAIENVWSTHHRADMDPYAIDVPKMRRLSYQGRTHEIVRAESDSLNDGLNLYTIASSRVA